jgi:antitoxin VapB
MPLNIRNEEVNRLAGELAARKGVSKTEAVKLALVQALGEPRVAISEEEKARRIAAVRALQDRVAARKPTGLEADKAFYDWLNDE